MSCKEPLTREDLNDYLCHNYCEQTDYGRVACTSGPNGPIMCEGRYCDENYQRYLDAVADGTESNIKEDEE